MADKVSAETPGLVTALPGADLRETPGLAIDDRLREAVAGFSLFRRSSSVVSHPTTQGVSLRGLGSSGASRTLVLLDGIPMNDPFGGWVYWDRLAPDELERVEVSRGATTAAFGDRALGGSLAFFSREPERLHLLASYQGGSDDTHEVTAGFSNLWTRWAVSGDVHAFSTGGWYVVPAAYRGTVDERALSRFAAGGARVDLFGARSRLFLRFDALAEERHNGTVLQRNSTSLGMLSAHYALEAGRNTLSAVAYHTREEFHSTFSAIAAGRSSERLTSRQTVPAEGTGGGVFFRRSGKFTWVAGADASRAEGWSRERLYPTGSRLGGGHLFEQGTFVQGAFSAGPLRLFAGARHDFTPGDRRFFSPSGGATLGRGRLRARASLYRGFRSPTLNELYRDFRVGNALTRANADLRPETVFGSEAGVDFVGERLRASVTAYRNSLASLITNVTLTATPDLIVRQRQNAAAAVARGVEARLERRWREFRGELGYLLADARFNTGARLPQVPRQQGTARFTFERGGTLLSAGMLSAGYQYEDERNLRASLLPGYATVHLFAARRITGSLSAIAELNNAFDRQYVTGLTPTPTVGTPRLWRVGVRWDGRLR
ncbi:MAG TPA: TonB-dependent receptor [Bryobacteraceae bacterium]|nr:TonB-dependent receptor [Bryobacteraceae bacterium]